MLSLNAQIAAVLNRPAAKIKTVETWAKVFFVKFTSGSPRFVSIAKVAALATAQPKPFTFTMDADRSRRKPWAARITGLSGDQYKLSREWLTPSDIAWNRKGCESAAYTITEQGIYQDQDSGYYRVFVEGGELTYQLISQAEAVYTFEQAEITGLPPAHPAAVGLF
jgi:hypothetical protein